MTWIPGITLGTTLRIRRFCMSERSGLIASKLGFRHQVFPDLAVQTAQKSVSSDQICFTLLHIAIYIIAENVPEKKLKQSPSKPAQALLADFQRRDAKSIENEHKAEVISPLPSQDQKASINTSPRCDQFRRTT